MSEKVPICSNHEIYFGGKCAKKCVLCEQADRIAELEADTERLRDENRILGLDSAARFKSYKAQLQAVRELADDLRESLRVHGPDLGGKVWRGTVKRAERELRKIVAIGEGD